MKVVVFEGYFDRTNGYIGSEVLSQCGTYMVEVFPVNGWEQNGGLGKRAAISFDHKIGIM